MLIAAASLRTDFPWIGEVLGVSLAKWVPQNIQTMTPQAFANTVYGLGVLNLGNEPEVVEAVESCAKAIPVQMGRFTSMDIAQVAWGIGARASQEEVGELLDAIEQWVIREVSSMSTKSALIDLPMIAVAYARLGDWRPAMLDGIARRVYRDVEELRLWSLAALLWVWSDQASPWKGEFTQPDSFPTIEEGSGHDTEEVAKLFLGKLKDSARKRRIKQEDIDRAPTGPKGETSVAWSGKSRPKPERKYAWED